MRLSVEPTEGMYWNILCKFGRGTIFNWYLTKCSFWCHPSAQQKDNIHQGAGSVMPQRGACHRLDFLQRPGAPWKCLHSSCTYLDKDRKVWQTKDAIAAGHWNALWSSKPVTSALITPLRNAVYCKHFWSALLVIVFKVCEAVLWGSGEGWAGQDKEWTRNIFPTSVKSVKEENTGPNLRDSILVNTKANRPDLRLSN